MNYRPIFIAGCDRSGTTLLGDLLGNSRWSITTPESQFIHDLLIQIRPGQLPQPRGRGGLAARAFSLRLLGHASDPARAGRPDRPGKATRDH